jgi:O-antigen ligase
LVARAVAGVGAAALFLAMYLTFSRAAILSLFGLAVVIAWRVNRHLGQVVLIGGIVAGFALLPSYLALRSQVGAEGVLEPGSLLVTTDALRLQAWDSAFHMWLAEPITGQGFLAYKQLADAFGDHVLSSPHNEWLRLFAEEGVVAGIAGLAFIGSTIWWLRRRRDPLASGILAGAFGYILMASFNNPLLFVQVSAVAFTGIGFGLARAARSLEPTLAADPRGMPT